MSHVRMDTIHCFFSRLSPLNKFQRENIVRSITLIPFDTFLKYLVDVYVRSRWCVTCKNGWSLLLHFSVISFESFLKWKHCSLVKFIPFEIFKLYVVGICSGSRRYVTYKNGCSPMFPFKLLPLNQHKKGNLVHSIPSIPFEVC